MKTVKAVESFLSNCRARGLSPRTVVWYQYMLRAFSRENEDLPANLDRIEDFLGADVSDELRHGRFRALRAFYNFVKQRKYGPNPMKKMKRAPIKRKKIPRSLSLPELGWLLLAPLTNRDRIMIMTIIDTGIRVGELVGLDRSDVGDETIFVTGKTGQREVPVSPEIRRQLLELARSGPLFYGPKGRLTTSGAYQAIRKAMTRAGISGKKKGPHLLRHTFGRQYIVAGGSLVTLQRILGHASISTTRIYAELDMGDVLAQHRRFTPLKLAQGANQGHLWAQPADRQPAAARILTGG